MKTKLLALFILPTLLLSSCDSLFGVDSLVKEINVYDIDKLDSDNNLSSGFQGTVKARYLKGKELVPYLSLKQYASLYEKHFAEDIVSKVENQSFSSTWTIQKGEEYYFMCQINYLTGDVVMAGSIEAAYSSNDDPRDLEALRYGMTSTTDNVSLSDKTYATLSFSGYGITHFTSNNEHYYSLGFLDTTFSSASSIYFTYNYAHIISTRDVDKYETYEYVDNGTTYTFDSQMLANRPEGDIPKYLVDYNSRLFLYMMDYFYGLKSYKGMKTATKYYKSTGVYSYLFSTDAETRTWAFSDALSMLDDNHTVLVSANKTWSDPNYRTSRRYGEGCRHRSEIRKELAVYRSDYYAGLGKAISSDIIYSADGKTALFSFDGFSFGKSSQVFNEDKSIKETAKDHDTFFKLIDAFNRIKSQGTVENIVLDVALNGGGTVGVMMKLLALISKDNKAELTLYDDTLSVASNYSAKVDINKDDKYDTDDCFGDEFNFYILTSDCSFSCGNAFPCSAQLRKDAKIIGQKSGGGECAVGIHYLPNSEYVYHSSNLHLGSFDKENKAFVGFESGATPDIEIANTSNFYNIEYLNTAITNAK